MEYQKRHMVDSPVPAKRYLKLRQRSSKCLRRITLKMAVRLLCSFYHKSLRTWIKTTVNKFAISNHTALILGVHALRSYLKLICEYELHSLPNKS